MRARQIAKMHPSFTTIRDFTLDVLPREYVHRQAGQVLTGIPDAIAEELVAEKILTRGNARIETSNGPEIDLTGRWTLEELSTDGKGRVRLQGCTAVVWRYSDDQGRFDGVDRLDTTPRWVQADVADDLLKASLAERVPFGLTKLKKLSFDRTGIQRLGSYPRAHSEFEVIKLGVGESLNAIRSWGGQS